MNFTKDIILVVILILGYANVYGCICGKVPTTSEYDYVALIEIKEILKSHLYKNGEESGLPKPIFHEIKVKTIKQYVGDDKEFLIVHGGNQKYNVGITSCDMNMEIGEKWIIYGMNFKNRISTNYCSLSILHANSNNEIDYKYNRSTERLTELESIFNSRNKKRQVGINQINYLNGKTQLKEEYDSNFNLFGIRQAFYSNGQLMVDEFYNEGKKDGKLTWYHRDGKLHRTSTFNNGKETCETYYYNYLGNLRKINYFDEEGNYLSTQKNAR